MEILCGDEENRTPVQTYPNMGWQV